MASHVVVGSGKLGSRFIRHEYPVVEGLIAGTTKQTGHANLSDTTSLNAPVLVDPEGGITE